VADVPDFRVVSLQPAKAGAINASVRKESFTAPS
jgi:hypothetical protein